MSRNLTLESSTMALNESTICSSKNRLIFSDARTSLPKFKFFSSILVRFQAELSRSFKGLSQAEFRK